METKSCGADGKRFEADFQASIPEHIFSYRLRDAAGWSNAENTRFTPSNICDTIINYNGNLFLCELKSVALKSMPLGNLGIPKEVLNKKTGIKSLVYTKLDKMIEAGNKTNTKAVYIINFRGVNKTYIIEAKHFKEIFIRSGKKSISLDDVIQSGNGILMQSTLKKVRYSYKVLEALQEIIPF